MKQAAIYVRVSTADQHVESQLYDLRELAAQRGLEVVQEYRDSGVSGKRARRPGLDALIADARRRKFSVVLVAAFDRVARSVKHFLQVMDEFDSLGVIFISRRENVDTSGPMGRLFLTLIGSIAELESDLIRERVLAGMRRAKLDGVRTGVAYRQHDMFSGMRAWVLENIMLVQRRMPRLDNDLASARHRITRVHYQIHEDLFKLARIGFDAANRRGRPEGERNILTDHPQQHRTQVFHYTVQIQNSWKRSPASG
jgi:DNA invertase Pin-like site-specific DNA recombinase